MLQHYFPPTPPTYTDRLAQLYPRKSDPKVHLDERLHKYSVEGVELSFSVSSWWQTCFSSFKAEEISTRIIRRYTPLLGFRDEDGLRERVPINILRSSVYNLRQHIRVGEGGSNYDFLTALQYTIDAAILEYSAHWNHTPFDPAVIWQIGVETATACVKPSGYSCHYLLLLYSRHKTPKQQTEDLMYTWSLHGKIESLKGSYLHKKIELFINALGDGV